MKLLQIEKLFPEVMSRLEALEAKMNALEATKVVVQQAEPEPEGETRRERRKRMKAGE